MSGSRSHGLYHQTREYRSAALSVPGLALQLEEEAGEKELAGVEIRLLLEGIYYRYGMDFREYIPSLLERRIRRMVAAEGLQTVSGLQERILHDPACFERFLFCLSEQPAVLFRDTALYHAFRQDIVPLLKTYPSVRIWHAGCSSGEEVYSLAILLQEEGIYHRCRLYATDLSEMALQKAREGRFPAGKLGEYEKQYRKAGGKKDFSRYYLQESGEALLHPDLMKNMVFFRHNLATDSSFNEFNVILCRHVLTYFTPRLQTWVHHLLYQSLGRFGLLALGHQESIQVSPYRAHYKEWALERGLKVYRKGT